VESNSTPVLCAQEFINAAYLDFLFENGSQEVYKGGFEQGILK
jgi:hypothetical protein